MLTAVAVASNISRLIWLPQEKVPYLAASGRGALRFQRVAAHATSAPYCRMAIAPVSAQSRGSWRRHVRERKRTVTVKKARLLMTMSG